MFTFFSVSAVGMVAKGVKRNAPARDVDTKALPTALDVAWADVVQIGSLG